MFLHPLLPFFGVIYIKRFLKIFSALFLAFFLIVLSCFSAFAESVYNVVDFDLTKLQIKYNDSSGVSVTPWKDITPNIYQSPYGGAFFGARDPGEQINDAMQWNSNWYLDQQFTFKKGVKYTISGYFCVPWDKLVTYDGYWDFQLLKIELIDSNRNSIYQMDYSNSYKQSSWIKRKISYFNVDFGFYPVFMEFVPYKDVKGWYFSSFIAYGLAVAPNNRGNFGFSDLTVSYSSDTSNGVASAVEGTNSRLDSINDSLNSDTYSKPDDSKLLEEDELTAEIYGDTSAGRDMTVDLITGITDPNDDPGGGSVTSFIEGMKVWVDIFGDLTYDVPWFNGMLEFSLAIGLFAFLLGFASIVIGSVRSSNNQYENSKRAYDRYNSRPKPNPKPKK